MIRIVKAEAGEMGVDYVCQFPDGTICRPEELREAIDRATMPKARADRDAIFEPTLTQGIAAMWGIDTRHP